jgi:secreted PhoX family phosphatase
VRGSGSGTITNAYTILSGTSRNCAGGATPWDTWLSCEDTTGGYVHETDPFGNDAAVRRGAMGRFTHEAAACDADRQVVYLTENPPLTGVDNITGDVSHGDLHVAEDGASMRIRVITPDDIVAPFLRITGQSFSEICGPAFNPAGDRLYFSSQRGTSGSSSGGITYEVTGPFRA